MGGYNVQPVFTYTPKVGSHDDHLEEYTNAVKNLSSPSSIALFEPEPVCAVRAAKYNNLLPSGMPGPVLVIDVGASATSMSIVDSEKESIQYHSRLDGFGGETLLETLMDYLSKSFFGCRHTEASDKMAVQRLYDAAQGAIMERQKLGRIQINIPYLSMDEKMQPRHLNEGLSLSVLEAAFDDMVKDNIAGQALEQNVLSQTNQNPSDVSALFSSMIMSVLEHSGQNPFSLNSILVVGGGARSPMCQQAIKKAIGALAGEQFVAEKVIIPQDGLIEELVALGATLE
uniref:Uncharacterized protein n=1 Tax=Chaetoceros debilis TaxID=122233 RepID=A0A7S3VBS4_9STRA